MDISFQEVTFGYSPSQKLLDHFTYTFQAQKNICLTGKSGCGKTTLLRLIGGLETPQQGWIQRPDHAKISFVFQENRLLPWMTVEENVALVNDDPKAVSEALNTVNLSDAKKERPADLSGGMRRRVAIARALAFQGDVLLLDEPFTGLDFENKRKITRYILENYKEKLVVLVSHIPQDASLFQAEILSL